jgi:hypothetical protein
MSQQRECCCGDSTEITCVNYDKVFRHPLDERLADPRGRSYRTPRVKTSYGDQLTRATRSYQEAFGTPYWRRNKPQELWTQPGSNNTNEWHTTGMSCMLCQHALIMNMRRPPWDNVGYIEQQCTGSQQDDQFGCPAGLDQCNQRKYYFWGSQGRVQEEELSALYVHWKDYWYFEPGPAGVPYTWWDEGRASNIVGSALSPIRGNQRFGFPPSRGRFDCQSTIPHPTDANYMCHPELKRVTNPLNPFFYRVYNGTDIDGNASSVGAGGSAYDRYLRSALYNHDPDAIDNVLEPELMNIRSGVRSNHNPVNPVIGGQFGLSEFGFSSWQCYTMQHNPELRTLADVVSFADGLKFYETPDIGGSSSQPYGDLYTTMIGTIYRARLWVRADKFYLQTAEDKFGYPCTTGFGEEEGTDETLGVCCQPYGNCIEGVSQSLCELGMEGAWKPYNWCDISCDEQIGSTPDGYAIYGGACTPCCCQTYPIDCGDGGDNCTPPCNEPCTRCVSGSCEEDPNCCNPACVFPQVCVSGTCEDADPNGGGSPPLGALVGGAPGNIYDLNQYLCREYDINCGAGNRLSCCAVSTEEFPGPGEGSIFPNQCKSSLGCTADCGSTTGPELGPNNIGEITAFHPPIVNEKMRKGNFNGGYRPCVKQHSGPWGMIYMCAGVPVFSYELDELAADPDVIFGEADKEVLERSWARDYPDDLDGFGIPGGGYGQGDPQTVFECTRLGPVVEKLGDTGKFNAKDWREDQLDKFDTLETEFRRIQTENSSEVPPEYRSYSIPGSIRTPLTPNDDTLGTTFDHEILPVQKTHRFLLSAFINQSLGKEEVRRGEGTQKYKISGEMSDYQISEPIEGSQSTPGEEPRSYTRGFKIEEHDPWHPNYEGSSPLGLERSSKFPLDVPLSWGNFNLRYPIQDLYDSFYGEGVVEIPEWEKEMFEAWYKNIPVYFHTTPGGWSWSGTGWGPVPRNEECNWGNGPGGNFNLGQLDNLYQIEFNTKTGESCVGSNPSAYAKQCCRACEDSGCTIPSFPPFPNNVNLYTEPVSGVIIPTLDLQPRDLPGRTVCRTLPAQCLGCSLPYAQNQECEALDDGPNYCCDASYQGCHLAVNGPVYPNCTIDYGDQCIVSGSTSYNCCREFDPYGLGFTKFASVIMPPDRDDVLGPNSTPYEEKKFLAKNYPENRSMGGPGCISQGQGCSSENECGSGCICCCQDGCSSGSCVCQDINEECSGCEFGTDECQACSPPWNQKCCNFNGVCCVNETGGQTCREISEEECAALGGGEWRAFQTCDQINCGDDPPVGACCACRWKTGRDPGDGSSCIDREYGDCDVEYFCSDQTEKACGGGDVCPSGWEDCEWSSLNTPCADLSPACETDNDCNDPTGACCDRFGGTLPCLENATLSECIDDGGTWHQDETCKICLPEEMGCCLPDRTCQNVTSAEQCWDLGGVVVGSTCPEDGDGTPGGNPCADDGIYQHCCAGDTCIPFSNPQSCAELGGTLVPGSGQCPPNPCGSGDEPDTPDACPGIGANLTGCQPAPYWFGGIATQWHPLTQGQEQWPGACTLKTHEVMDECALWHYQASNTSFRIAVFSTAQNEQTGVVCPARYGADLAGRPAVAGCCCPECSGYWPTAGACNGDGFTVSDTLHSRKQEFVVDVFPFQLRCAQIADINGYQKCGLLETLLEVDDEEFLVRLPRVMIGRVDPLSCHILDLNGRGGRPEDTICAYVGESCSVDPQQPASCFGGSSVNTTTYSCEAGAQGGPPSEGPDENCITGGIRVINTPRNINHGGYCISLDKVDQFAGYSYEAGLALYNPHRQPIFGIPQFSCPGRKLSNTVELTRPSRIPQGTVLRRCAEYWNDKTASDMDLNELLNLPETTSGLVFRYYGGVGSPEEPPPTEPVGVSAEWVKNDTEDSQWPDFWMKRKYPSLDHIKLFGVGDFSAEGGFGGGKEAPGQFAGSLVPIFKTEQDQINFDAEIGNKNLLMQIGVGGIPGQPDTDGDNAMANCKFIARPSRNPYWTDCDPNDESTQDCIESGWKCGRGFTYADVKTGTGPAVGKVYEFCSDNTSGECGLKPQSGEPFSGIRGPVGFQSRDLFVVNLNRLPGTTYLGFTNCDSNNNSSCGQEGNG